MSVNGNGQGQSAATIDKERCIASALSIGMKICNGSFGGRGFTYWHFDANAGSGWNELFDVAGSPIVFQRMADLYLDQMECKGFFCDINGDALKKLLLTFGRNETWNNRSFPLLGDNEEALQVFAECIRQSGEKPRFAVGSVIVDPNGYWFRNRQGIGAPTRGLLEFTNEFPRIDIVLNLNTRIYRLQLPHGHDVPEPYKVLASLNKKHWLIKRTQKSRGNEYLLAVGRNVSTGDHRAIGFHKLESEEGREIMMIAEGKRQPRIFDNALCQLP